MTASVWGPGRVNLIGERTVFRRGRGLPSAIQLGIHLTFALGEGITLTSAGERVALAADGAGTEHGWGRYVAAVAQELAELGRPPVGIDGAVESDLPPGAGLRSSGAFEGAVRL